MDGLQVGVDTRRFITGTDKRARRSDAGRWRIVIRDADKYVCLVDGKHYVFAQVLTRMAKDAGCEGAVNALYRYGLLDKGPVLLWGVKAFCVEDMRESGLFAVTLDACPGKSSVGPLGDEE